MLEKRKHQTQDFQPLDWRQCDSKSLLERIRDAEIVGMGGSGFSTYQKIRSCLRHGFRQVLANGVECEPGVQSDQALIREHAADVLEGLQIVGRIGADVSLQIAVSSPETLSAIDSVLTPEIGSQLVANTPSAGEERNLIRQVYDEVIPEDQYPSQFGILVLNVATLFAVCEAVRDGRSLKDRVTTVEGTPRWVELGISLQSIMGVSHAIRAGSKAIGELVSPNYRMSASVNAISLDQPEKIKPCIHCGWCNQVCPKQLDVESMLMYADSETNAIPGQLSHHYSACFECGACVEACPSQIPLLDAIRLGRQQVKEQLTQEAALVRYDRRVERLKLASKQEDDARQSRMKSQHRW